jgi:hypothetical protein
MELNIEILIIMFSPFVVLLLFQISNYLNQGLLSIGRNDIEIDEFAQLSGLPENRIRMIPLREKEKVKFKVLDENCKEEIASVIFDKDSSKIIENNNLEISEEKMVEFRKIVFSRLTSIPLEKIRISEDGDTFSEIEFDPEGKEIIKGSVTFDRESYRNPPVESSGKFKAMF